MRDVLALGARVHLTQPAFAAMLNSIESKDFLRAEELAQLKIPTLLLWGKAEQVLPPSGLRFYRKSLPSHAVIEEPREWGHCPFWDKPAQLTRRISDFARYVTRIDRAPVTRPVSRSFRSA